MAKELIVLQEQGSFTVGGKTVKDKGDFDPLHVPNPYSPADDPERGKPTGQTLRGDHAYVFYQVPETPKKNPIVFLHGALMTGQTWETTCDGREGFQNIFLRKGYSVYLVDQPRRGRAGRATLPGVIPLTYDDESQFNLFRCGMWPNVYEDAAFPRDEESFDQFRRMATPNTADFDPDVVADAMAALFDKIGGGVLMSHSQGGGCGWKTAAKTSNLNGIVSIEPGSGFIFPEGEVPDPIEGVAGWTSIAGIPVPMEDFLALTKIPIMIYYGDMIPTGPMPEDPGRDQWYVRVKMARLFAECVNKHGGNAKVVLLPDLGIYGNTHFAMSDLNNQEVADEIDRWLREADLA